MCLSGTFSFTLRSTCTHPGYCRMRSTSSACYSIRASVHWPLGLAPDWDQKTRGGASLGHVPTSQCHWQPVDFS
eukprot:7390372-Prymnesium_polylepis.1